MKNIIITSYFIQSDKKNFQKIFFGWLFLGLQLLFALFSFILKRGEEEKEKVFVKPVF